MYLNDFFKMRISDLGTELLYWKFYFIFNCVYECSMLIEYQCPQRSELELGSCVTLPTWVPRLKPESSARASDALNCQAISLALRN